MKGVYGTVNYDTYAFEKASVGTKCARHVRGRANDGEEMEYGRRKERKILLT